MYARFHMQHPSVVKVASGHKMQSFRSEHESGLYLARLQGYGGGGEQVFRLDCQRGTSGGKKSIRGERKKSRLMSRVEIRRKEGRSEAGGEN